MKATCLRCGHAGHAGVCGHPGLVAGWLCPCHSMPPPDTTTDDDPEVE